jgi:hypothetical protein
VFTLTEMSSMGFEQNAAVVRDASEVFVDETSYVLRERWKTAGRNGDAPGPDDVALVLDPTRYGPAALCP